MSNNPGTSKVITDEDNQSLPPAYNQEEATNGSSSDLTNTSNYEKTIVVKDDEKHEEAVSKWRLFLRIFQMLAVIGSFGFQASANTWSGRDTVPFNSVALLYFFYAIEWLSFIWSSFCIYVFFSMKFNSRAGNIKPAVGLGMDTLLTVVLGIAISMEIGTYSCPAGDFNGWCNFYNVGLSFGMALFLSFVVSALWGLFSNLSCLRTTTASAKSNLV